MSEDLHNAITLLAVFATLAVVLGIAWWRASRRVRELERYQFTGAQEDPATTALEARLAALADHVEQLANGQEFLSRVMTDRRQVPAARSQRTPPQGI